VNNFEQQRYHDKVTCDFAEMIYKQMASIRYGLEFCCDKGNDAIVFRQALVKKEKLDLNDLLNPIVDDVVQDVPDGQITRPFILDCDLITLTGGIGDVGSITYAPCGESELKTYNFDGIEVEARSFCYNKNTIPVITGPLVSSTPVPCGTPATTCIEIVFTLPAPTVEGETTEGTVFATGCFGDTISSGGSLTWVIGEKQPDGIVGLVQCINTALPIIITGDIISNNGNPCT